MPTLKLPEILCEKPPVPDWVIERFIPRDTVTVLAGLEGTGKSSLSYSLALCVALGVPFLDRPTQRLRVLYYDNENSQPDCSQYLRRLWLGLGCPDPLALSQFLRIEHFSLSVGWQRTFETQCREWDPGLVIIDTSNSCFSIKDENSNAEAAEIISFIQGARPSKSSVILMKHEREPKEGAGRSVRGAKYWLGAVDQVVYLHRDTGRPSGPTPVGTEARESERYHRTKLMPAKHRAFGLDEAIHIVPKISEGLSGKSLIFCTR
jgi:RecA-family ATPase